MATSLGVSVELRSVRKSFSGTEVVHGIDLKVPGGSYATLLGPSGSGKTTILRLIAGLEAPDSGSILLGDLDATGLDSRSRNIGLVFQHYVLFPHMTAFENIAYPLRLRRVSNREQQRLVREYLSMVQLKGIENRYPRQLSGGQQQRVALARALVYRPRLLLLDEPLGALDKRLRIETQQQLKALHRELGITFVHVTHDQSEALALSSLLIVMRNGEIQQVGDPEVVYRRPNSLFAADFLGDMNFVPCELTIQHPTSIDVALPSGSVLSLPRELLAPVVDPSHGLILAFRPEDGVLGAPGRAQGGEEFGFEGTIRDQSFRDGWYDIRIATGAGDLLLRSSAACSLGEHVACVWPTSRVCLFPRDESFN